MAGRTPSTAGASALQHTLQGEAVVSGVGLHSGEEVTVALRPAAVGTGIVFRRVDLGPASPPLPATWRNVVDGRRATTIGNGGGIRISTIEHLMAALAACGVDNVLVEIDRPELPAMDGSAAPFVSAIGDTGTAGQEAPRLGIEVRKRIEISDGDRRVALEPGPTLTLAFTIDYPDTAIGRQSLETDAKSVDFRTEICPARTFCLSAEVDALRARGLGLGGSLENTLVVGTEGLVNDGPLRFADEFVRHKILDCLGDLYLVGRPLIGRFEGTRSGHAMTHALIAALMSDRTAWREILLAAAEEPRAGRSPA
jgi:UDP-3-O-[3-hydroxymyristoyl] N-acetylglucosamine deacetylase